MKFLVIGLGSIGKRHIKNLISLGIKKENIQFTCMESKSYFLSGKGFIFHLDDDDIELMDILENNKFTSDKCFPVNVGHFEWEESCRDILKINLAE